ncbi:Cytidylate kinase [Neobacillus rhizosphaerae]|uniref:Cytidylate kinase n=1 Tax=Neobacillus rhizosphaerae TaxID=2880965 RepID=A0ABN8KTY8_9BACI|nr:AAA family ATPase [Neobacillus rhizosphaerae]CAH2715920.1 Cytidylate kinase [Neobacillus rhizosphaerae]
MTLEKGIYIVTGIMASGKSTIAQMLSEQFEKGVHVRGDIFRKMIVKGNIDMTPGYSQSAVEQLVLRYKMTAKVAEMYYKAGFSVVVQDTYLGKEVASFLEAFESKPVYFITLNPNVEAIIEREKKRNKSGYTTWEVEPLYKVLINENPRIGLWVDSSDMTPEETISEIIKRVKSEARII